jgi:hypothetical protein
MKLTPAQLEQFRTEGWLFLPELFNAEEVEVLRREAVSIYDEQRPEVWREKAARRAPPLPRIFTMRRFACLARIRA